MQLCGGVFPSGGFSQSWGLETYAAEGKINNDKGLLELLKVYLESTISRCEGPILCAAYEMAEAWEEEKILQLEEMSCAVKVTKESREATLRMGKAFLRIMADILDDEEVSGLRKLCGPKGISYPVAYGLICSRLGLELPASVEAFVFSTVNGLVQSAVKLIPLGNTQAQKILLDIQPAMEQAAADSLELPFAEISNFSPGLDIASIIHETLPVRLYMS